MSGSSSQSVQIRQIDCRNHQITDGQILQGIHLQPFFHADIEQQEKQDVDSEKHRETVGLSFTLQIEGQRLPHKQEEGTDGIENEHPSYERSIHIRTTEEIICQEPVENNDNAYKQQANSPIQSHHLRELPGNLMRCLPTEGIQRTKDGRAQVNDRHRQLLNDIQNTYIRQIATEIQHRKPRQCTIKTVQHTEPEEMERLSDQSLH